MRYELETLVLYDSRLFNRTGHVGRWAESVARNFKINAVARAPVNKRPNKSPWYSRYPVGSLKSHIDTDAYRVGPRHWEVTLQIDVPYARFVLGGTTGPITATGDYMWLPRNPGFRKRKHYTVAGQRANNFLAGAADATARRHPSLRGLGHLMYHSF